MRLLAIHDELQAITGGERLLPSRPAPRFVGDGWPGAGRSRSERDQVAEKFGQPENRDLIRTTLGIGDEIASPIRGIGRRLLDRWVDRRVFPILRIAAQKLPGPVIGLQ